MTLFYYTATGNSLEVAKAFEANRLSIPQLMRESKEYEDEAIGFVFPCYMGSIPTLVEQFIQSNSFKADYFFAVITYGNLALGLERMFYDFVGARGIHLNYLAKIKMVDSSLLFFDMAKQKQLLPKRQVFRHISHVVQQVELRKENRVWANVWKRKYSRLGRLSYRKELGSCDLLYSVEDSCNLCGVCATVCPVGNIRVTDVLSFRHQCLHCYACTQNCPTNSIRFRDEHSRERYRNSAVTLEELVESNNQLQGEAEMG